MRSYNYSIPTERSYWIRHFIHVHRLRLPLDLGTVEVKGEISTNFRTPINLIRLVALLAFCFY